MKNLRRYLFGTFIIILISLTACRDLPWLRDIITKKKRIKKTDIVFARGATSSSLSAMDLYAMKADGSGIIQLTDDNIRDVEPVWGPKGKLIIFESFREERAGGTGIYKLDLRGRDAGITKIINTENRDSYPDVSPDGSKVVFSSFLGTDLTGPAFEIFTANMDGTGLTRLTTANGDDASPDWSPDGTKIAFVSERDEPDPVNPNEEIYVMNADGSGLTRLTNSGGGSSPTPRQDIDPAWSRMDLKSFLGEVYPAKGAMISIASIQMVVALGSSLQIRV